MVGVWGEEEGGNFVSMRQNMSVFYFAGTPKTIITFYRWPQTILSTVFGTNALCLLIYKPKLNISKTVLIATHPSALPSGHWSRISSIFSHAFRQAFRHVLCQAFGHAFLHNQFFGVSEGRFLSRVFEISFLLSKYLLEMNKAIYDPGMT